MYGRDYRLGYGLTVAQGGALARMSQTTVCDTCGQATRPRRVQPAKRAIQTSLSKWHGLIGQR